jgi:hypothetical protein
MYAFKPTQTLKKFAPAVSKNIKFNPKIIIDGVIIYSKDGFAYCKTDNDLHPLNDKSASVVGLSSIWCSIFDDEGEMIDTVRVQDSRFIVSVYTHPHKYRDRYGDAVQGYVTHKNEFHVTKRINSKFSTRKQRESF